MFYSLNYCIMTWVFYFSVDSGWKSELSSVWHKCKRAFRLLYWKMHSLNTIFQLNFKIFWREYTCRKINESRSLWQISERERGLWFCCSRWRMRCNCHFGSFFTLFCFLAYWAQTDCKSMFLCNLLTVVFYVCLLHTQLFLRDKLEKRGISHRQTRGSSCESFCFPFF